MSTLDSLFPQEETGSEASQFGAVPASGRGGGGGVECGQHVASPLTLPVLFCSLWCRGCFSFTPIFEDSLGGVLSMNSWWVFF